MISNIDAARRCSRLADELRTMADAMKDPEDRADLENWAKRYDRLAELAMRTMPLKQP